VDLTNVTHDEQATVLLWARRDQMEGADIRVQSRKRPARGERFLHRVLDAEDGIDRG